MPRLNGTGPNGQGPMTGRGLGTCGGRVLGCGYCGRGFGMSLERFFRSPKNQLQALEDEERALLDELEAIKAEKESLANPK